MGGSRRCCVSPAWLRLPSCSRDSPSPRPLQEPPHLVLQQPCSSLRARALLAKRGSSHPWLVSPEPVQACTEGQGLRPPLPTPQALPSGPSSRASPVTPPPGPGGQLRRLLWGRRAAGSCPVLCFTAAAARWCPQCEDADHGQLLLGRASALPSPSVWSPWVSSSALSLVCSWVIFLSHLPPPAFWLVTPDSVIPRVHGAAPLTLPCLNAPTPRVPPGRTCPTDGTGGRPRLCSPSAAFITHCPFSKAHREPALKFEEKEKSLKKTQKAEKQEKDIFFLETKTDMHGLRCTYCFFCI